MFLDLDVDECTYPDICPEHSACNNIESSFECLCHSGYRKVYSARLDEEICEDINECDESTHDCGLLQCFNEIGNFTCGCFDGYHENQAWEAALFLIKFQPHYLLPNRYEYRTLKIVPLREFESDIKLIPILLLRTQD